MCVIKLNVRNHLAGRLAGRRAGWPAGRLAGWLAGWPPGWPITYFRPTNSRKIARCRKPSHFYTSSLSSFAGWDVNSEGVKKHLCFSTYHGSGNGVGQSTWKHGKLNIRLFVSHESSSSCSWPCWHKLLSDLAPLCFDRI